ncbi:hypothetical protein LW135_01125 [Helicobacter sp. faydin-H20]|uniref:hypothetical protein n=1 Tax=Helicobacter anatolicus TaxID=2905874 RepID=UPI001E478AC8|nr:hypothetical protein [Helicobacter anatolicus]MCE3036436.1 hypothetical protein [Helicobacter anatolicus]
MKNFLKQFLFLFVLFFLYVYAEDDTTLEKQEFLNLPLSPSKIIYIKNITPTKELNKTIYIGQTIKVTYNLLLFSNAKLISTDFDTAINTKSIKPLNAESEWEIQDDENNEGFQSYQKTYIYKILNKNATIPQIKAIAVSFDKKYQDVAISPKINLDIYNLKNNPKYSGIIADNLKILRTKTKVYDEKSNIMVLELEGQNANLEDFIFPNTKIIKQGIQNIEDNKAIYFCILPKTISSLSFDFFSLPNNQFQTLTIPILVSYDNVAAQDDIKPKNIFLLYSTLFLIAGILILLIVYIFLWRNKWLLLPIFLLSIYLAWHLFYRNDIILQPNQTIKILPTQNSTTLFVVEKPIEAEIIGSHQNFYKIITKDGRIGWIKKR